MTRGKFLLSLLAIPSLVAELIYTKSTGYYNHKNKQSHCLKEFEKIKYIPFKALRASPEQIFLESRRLGRNRLLKSMTTKIMILND